MHTGFKKIFFTALILFLIKSNFYSQQVTVTSATACPNQPVVLTAQWNNVTPTSFTISKSPTQFTVQQSVNFTVSEASTTNYTIYAQGNALSGPVSSTAFATLTIVAPQPLAISDAHGNPIGYYCYNSTATLTAPVGASTYSITGPTGALAPSNNNIINIPGLLTTYSGIYTITANMSGCVRSGVTTISVSTNPSLTVTPPVNVCQDQPINLSANLPGVPVSSYVWTNVNMTPVTSAVLQFPNATTAQTGLYNVVATFNFFTEQCTRSGNTTVNVVATSVPAITASPQGTLCQGSNLTLAATGSVTAAYSWTGPGFTSSLANPVISNVTPANSGVYSVTATFVNNIVCTKGAAITVSVVGTVDPSITGPSNVCQNETTPIQFSVTAAGANGGFSWTGPGTFASASSAPTVAATPSNSGVYYATAHFFIGSVYCTTTKSIVVNVVPVNTISVLPPADVCQPDNAYLFASSVGATTFTWNGPNGNVGYTSNIILYHPPVSATGVYTITMGFTGGGLTCTNTNTVSLLVKPLLNFTLAPSSLACYNTNIQISGPAGASSYSWTSSSGYTTSSQDVVIPSAQPSNSGTYFLMVSLNGCITSGSTAITVLDPVSFAQPFFDRSICRGDSIHMEASLKQGSGNYAYTWKPGVSLTAITGSVTDGAPEGTTVYNIVAYDIACPNYSVSADIRVDVKQPPQSHLELTQTEGCAPLCQFYDTKSDFASTAWVTYDFGGNLKFQQDSFYRCLTAPGTYTLKVTLTGNNGCSGTVTYPSPIYVYPKPSMDIVTNPEFPTVTDQVVFTAATNYSVASYRWIFTNPLSSPPDTLNIASPVQFFETSGTYPVYLSGTTDMGCADTVIKHIEIRDDFNVFIPNSFTPNDDGLNDVFAVKGGGIKPENFTMDVVDRKGQTIFSTRDLNQGWDGTYKGSKAQQDVYVYKIVLVGAHSEGKKQYIGHFSLLR